MAATLFLWGAGLSWKQSRVGHAILLAFASLFLVTHVLDQTHTPGPTVSEVARISGFFPAWVTMLWAWASVMVIALSLSALVTARRESVRPATGRNG